MTACIACNRPNGDPSASMPQMHASCWIRLPQLTRTLYTSGGLPKPRLVEIAKERNASVRAHGGGRAR